uniref:DUF38 domain-containing protein n=1 Tax=Panagrellus redivivus TaxID=6233 RepID=A0A7E4VWK4_PANRE
MSSDIVEIRCSTGRWELIFVNLMKLCTRWARKLNVRGFEWLYASPRTGYSKIMAENSDLEELCVDNTRFNDWTAVLKAFPKLVVVRTSARDFASMLLVASTELACLKEVVFCEWPQNKCIVSAHQALYKHQKKCPNLETLKYVATPLAQIRLPARFPKKGTIPSIKHVKVTDHTVECCSPLNYSALTALQKAFPSLESVEITAHTDCGHYCEFFSVSEKLPTIDRFYRTLESLNIGFTIKVTYREKITFCKTQGNPLHPHFLTKGKVSGTPEKFTVKTSYPGKELIYEVDISQFEDYDENDNEDEYVYDDYDSPLDYAYRMMAHVAYDDDYDYL